MLLTDETIFALTATKPQQEFFDSGWAERGSFGVRVNRAKGEKVFFLMYSMRGKRRRFPLGRFPTLSVEEAKDYARNIISRVNSGEDPAVIRRVSKDEGLFSLLCSRYLRDKQLGEKTRKEYERIASTELLPLFKDRHVESISERELRRLLYRIGEERSAPTLANRVRALLHAVFEFSIATGHLESNPLGEIRPNFKEKALRKDRARNTVPFETIQEIFGAAREIGDSSGALAEFALLSGVSATKLCSLRWSDLRGDFCRVGSALINITPLHREILNRASRDSEYLFTSKSGAQITNSRSILQKIERRTDLKLPYNWSEIEGSTRGAMIKLGLPYTEVSLVFGAQGKLGVEPPENSLVEWASRRIFSEWAQLLANSGPEDRGKVVRLRRFKRLK